MANLMILGWERFTGTYWRSATIWDITQPVGAAVSTTMPRSGGSQQSLSGDAFVRTGVRSLGGNFAHLFAGRAELFRMAALLATPTTVDFALLDGATCQVGWYITSLGEVVVVRGNTTIASATELGRTATGVIAAAGTGGTGSDYKMVEMGVVFATGATGSVEIKVGGVSVLTLSGVQTSATANAYANRLFYASRNSSSWFSDDWYVNDDSGTAPENTFFGEAFVVESIIPTGNGNSSQFVGSDGNSTDNYLLVDDSGNDDTDYVKSGTLNDLDTYAMGNLSNATGTVVRASHYFIARKDDVASRTLASALRTNSTNYISATNKTMAGTYGLFIDERTVNPDTTLRFTISEINAIEYGTKVTT